MNSSLNATLLSTVSLQIILSVSLMSQKEERPQERVWTKRRKKKHLRGPFCHLIWIFSVKPLANFRKNSPFLSNFFWQFSSESSLLKWPLLQSHLNFRHIYHFRCCVNVCTHLDTLGKNTCTFTWATYPAPPYVVSLAQKGYPPSWVLFWYRHGMSSHDILVAYFVMFHPGV